MGIMPSGRIVLPDNDVVPTLSDIAHNLSRQFRFNGANVDTPGYSVLQHSLVVGQCLPLEYRWMGFLHDSTEAVMGDCVRPWKPAEFVEREKSLLDRILKSFGLPAAGHWPVEGAALCLITDMQAACAEALLLFGESAREWCRPWHEPSAAVWDRTKFWMRYEPEGEACREAFEECLSVSMYQWKQAQNG